MLTDQREKLRYVLFFVITVATQNLGCRDWSDPKSSSSYWSRRRSSVNWLRGRYARFCTPMNSEDTLHLSARWRGSALRAAREKPIDFVISVPGYSVCIVRCGAKERQRAPVREMTRKSIINRDVLVPYTSTCQSLEDKWITTLIDTAVSARQNIVIDFFVQCECYGKSTRTLSATEVSKRSRCEYSKDDRNVDPLLNRRTYAWWSALTKRQLILRGVYTLSSGRERRHEIRFEVASAIKLSWNWTWGLAKHECLLWCFKTHAKTSRV